MSRCEIFKEPNNIHIYVTTSVTNFGVILFPPYMDTVEFSFAVDSWRYPQCPPPWPLKPSEGPLFHMSTHTSCAFIAANTVPDSKSCLWVETELREAWISISAYEHAELLTRKFSVAYCNAYSETNVVYKNWRYPQKLTFTDTAGPTDMLQ